MLKIRPPSPPAHRTPHDGLLQWQTKHHTQRHRQLCRAELQWGIDEQREDARAQHLPGILQVPQGGGEHHDEQSDPEQREEPPEVVVLRL